MTSVDRDHGARALWRGLLRACLLLVLLAAGAWAQAQTCGVPGWAGPATVSGVINSYHGGSGSPAAGATAITVASATGQRSSARQLIAGDMILIMQMQDSAGSAAGVHEYAQIVSVSGTTLNLNRALTNSYVQNMSTSSVRNWQVVYVPQYSALTITATVTPDRWAITTATGVATGGIVAFDVAGSLALNGIVSVAGSGFRGAMGLHGTGMYAAGTATTSNVPFTPTSVATIQAGQKGEGTQGSPPVVFTGALGANSGAGQTALLGQGYTLGAGGQQAIGNAGGAANNGLNTDNNNYNAGGGGGGNQGAGGQGGNSWNGNTTTPALNQNMTANIGNVAGGKGGNAFSNSATQLQMGGGGGSGGANNGGGTANNVTTWPPTTTSTVANGAQGPVTSSGAPGGGVVLIRAGSISSTAGVIDASGYRAYNKSLTADTDAAGGGGGGGSVFITAGSGNGAGLTINANGGDGGSSNYFNHGPGGGGGGGYIVTNLTGATRNTNGGAAGTDGCCGGTTGNGSPKNYDATAGSAGSSVTTGGTAVGVQGGASCLPVITVTKSTTTPTRSYSATGATASYSIALSNAGGAAADVFVRDPTLPLGWGFTTAAAPTYTYSPSPPPAANSNAAGAETTAAGTPGVSPVNTITNANSITAVSLRAAATAPGVTPANGSNSATFGSFYLPQNASMTVTYLVTIPATATVGVYHNPAGVMFLDPTRTTTGSRMVTPASEASSNRQATAYANTTYASGSTTNVLGANYNGLAAGPAGEDVKLIADFSVSKSATASSTPNLTITYTITPRNNGWAVGSLTYAVMQASDITTANIPTNLGFNPLTVIDTLPTGVTLSSVFVGAGWSCSGTNPQTCTRSNANAWPVAASTDFAIITGSVTLTAVCTGATPRTNTVTISTATDETSQANNTATAVTTITCPTSANIQVTKTNNVTTVASGSTTTYTITVTNSGPGAAGGTTLTDVAQGGLTCSTVACTGFGATCPAASMPFGSLTTGVTIPTFPSGTSATFVVACGVP